MAVAQLKPEYEGSVDDFYGSAYDRPPARDPVTNQKNKGRTPGRGAYGLPDAFGGWSGPARYAIPGVARYVEGVQPVREHFANELKTDRRSQLAEQGRKRIDTELAATRRGSADAAVRGGYGGGTVSSPLAAAELATEEQARAGAYGLAAQQATYFAQQMKNDAATGLQNIEANILNAYLVPGQIQAANRARVPVSGGGPNTWATTAQVAAGIGSMFV